MSQRAIPLSDVRALLALTRARPDSATERDDLPPLDRLHRPLRDLRISVTDRCNFRCSYCMPKEVFGKTHPFLPQSALLSFEEIERIAATFVLLGVRKLRLTGGEPLLRRNLDGLVARLAALRTPSGEALDLTLTTNASVLAAKAQALKSAGLNRVTVSLDALDDTIFRQLNDADFPVASVLAGIGAALRVGLGPIKVNMVVQRGVNESQILPMVRHFRDLPVTLRFIEYMDVGATNGWRLDDVLPSAEIAARIDAVYPIERLPASAPGETAERWRFRRKGGDSHIDGAGEIGFISSVSKAFCGDCNRARLSTEGRLYTCLFATQGHDLRALLRGGADDAQLRAAVARLWRARSDRYSELRGRPAGPVGDTAAPAAAERRIEMHYIGG